MADIRQFGNHSLTSVGIRLLKTQFHPFDVNEFLDFIKMQRRGFKFSLQLIDNTGYSAFYAALHQLLDKHLTRTAYWQLRNEDTGVIIKDFLVDTCWILNSDKQNSVLNH
uniref:DUF2326 domain-containing protein n=1 Tax=Panagrellus redivivus TaxID=6233 RepID=A0A7E4VNV0_PANRE